LSRIKERNKNHLEDQVAKKNITIIFNSQINEINEHDVLLSTPNGDVRLQNDFVFICAGGEMPFDFLKKIGISMQQQTID
jgi:thioredoxin reductase